MPESEPPQPEMALGMPYVRALARSGAIPVVLPPLALELMPGLLAPLAGRLPLGRPGPRPGHLRRRAARRARPGRARRSTPSSWRSPATPTPPGCRSSASAAAARRSTSRAAAAASSTCPTTDGEHREPGWAVTHDVAVEAGSLLARAVGAERAARELVPPPGRRAARRRPAGGRLGARRHVEGIEGDDGRFVLGVQWHAETLDEVEQPQARLFGALVEAARDAWRVS